MNAGQSVGLIPHSVGGTTWRKCVFIINLFIYESNI